MADNLSQNGTGLVATDEITQLDGVTVPAVQAQLVKTVFGSNGVARMVDAANGLPVVQVANSLVSTVNSSAAALAANATFTGTAEDVSEYSTIVITVFADQASATDGLSVQQSTNGTNWDLTDVYTVPINSGKTFSFGVQAKFIRIVYTNGATASTVLRLQTIYSKAAKIASSVRPQDARPNDNDFEEVLSFGMVYNGTSWDRLRGTIANGLAVDVTREAPLVAGSAIIGQLIANQSVITSDIRASTLHVTATVNVGATASLPAPATGLFHYITSVQLVKLYSVLGVASGAGVVITSTNLAGGQAWLTEQAAGAVGTAVRVIDYQPTTPLKVAAAATATTFVATAQLQTIWRWNVSYFTAA